MFCLKILCLHNAITPVALIHSMMKCVLLSADPSDSTSPHLSHGWEHPGCRLRERITQRRKEDAPRSLSRKCLCAHVYNFFHMWKEKRHVMFVCDIKQVISQIVSGRLSTELLSEYHSNTALSKYLSCYLPADWCFNYINHDGVKHHWCQTTIVYLVSNIKLMFSKKGST